MKDRDDFDAFRSMQMLAFAVLYTVGMLALIAFVAWVSLR